MMYPAMFQIRVPIKNIPKRTTDTPAAGPMSDPFKDIPNAPYNAKKKPGMQQIE